MCDRFLFGGESSLRSLACMGRVVEVMSGVEWDIKILIEYCFSIGKF